MLDSRASAFHNRDFGAGIAQLVERNLAKVEVASSNLVSRSNPFVTLVNVQSLVGSTITARGDKWNASGHVAEWQSGYAPDCKSVYLGSTPGSASICSSTVH